MEFCYTPRLRELKERASGLAGKLMAYEEQCEFRALSPEDLAALRQEVLSFGLQAINMPPEWGGGGLSYLEQVVVQEELGKLTNGLWELAWSPATALNACTPEQRERWLPPCIRGERRDAVAITEPEAGSDPQGIKTCARREGNHFRLSGEKWFVTVGDHADFLLVLASVPGEGPTIFLVDKALDGVEMKRAPKYMHNFVFEHPEFIFRGVLIGPEAVLGTVGGGYQLTRDWFTVNDDGHDMPVGQLGEIVIGGPGVVPGYWHRPEATAAALPAGEMHTGDIGFMDRHGWFYLVDRKKDVIIAGGYKVWPREVEDVLLRHPAVREAAVVGIPHRYRGEQVKAFVSVRPGTGVTEEDLAGF